jgi:hypothetical protein
MGLPEHSLAIRMSRVELLHRATFIAAVAGACGSLGLMLYAGRRNPSRLLTVLFAIWVLSPFLAALWASVVSRRWPVVPQATLYAVMWILTCGSLAIYGAVAFGYLNAKIGFVFLMVPLATWLLAAIAVSLAAFHSRG